MMIKPILFGTLLGLSALSTATFANDTFYKWVDAKGSTHYTQTPPPKGAKSLGTMKTYRDYSLPTQPAPAPVSQPVAEQSTSPYNSSQTVVAEPVAESSTTQPTNMPPRNPNAQYIPLPR